MAHLVRRSNLFIIIISFSAGVEEPHVKLVYMHECKLCSTARISLQWWQASVGY